jgi:aminoglycoside/choline kinase family phosphotransferase
MPHNDARLALIEDWLRRELRLSCSRIEPASSDASFRRYFRAFIDGAGSSTKTFVVMDAPPDKEDVRPYLKVTRLLEGIGAHVPHVHEMDTARGLLLLEDLGVVQYLTRLEAGEDADRLYGDALEALAGIQVAGVDASRELSPYDREPLARELALMPEWFCAKHLELDLSSEERELLREAFEFLIGEALAQPAVFVHRDYHSRNLMVLTARNPGIIDFQDALRGPIGYDLVSLLKDCYISWPRARVERWLSGYREKLRGRGWRALGSSGAEFLRWFDMIGVQRHIKVLGIFARLWYRDGKSGYLKDLPLTLEYVRDACARYPELAGLSRFVDSRLVPALPEANARVAASHAKAHASRSAGGREAV